MKQDFASFRLYLDRVLHEPLPGLEAHKTMVPLSRRLARERLLPRQDAQESSVLILIYPEGNEARFIMIKRPTYEGVHSGQIAFPGGRREASDTSHLQTAIRETREEIGIDIDNCPDARVHGQLSYLYIPPSNFKVYPFVATCSSLPDLIPDPQEVDEILNLPFDAFLDESSRNVEDFVSSYASVKAPCFKVDGHTIWGASAMMLSELVYICKDWAGGIRN